MENKKVFSNIIWRLLERSGAQLVMVIVSIVLSRLLDPKVFGMIAIVTVITTILQVFVDSGLGNALIQKKDSDDIDFSTVFYFNIFFSLIIYIALYIASPSIAKFYNYDQLTVVIRVLGLSVIVSALKNVQQAYVSKHLMFKKFFYSTLCGTISAAIIGIILAINGYGIWALVAQYLINLTIDTFVLWLTVKWRPIKVFSFKRFKVLFSYGWKLLASALLDTIFNNIRQLIIGKMYSPADLAFYDKGMLFPNGITANINVSIESVLLPTMSEKQDKKSAVKEVTRQAIKTSSFIMWPMMIGLAACAEPFVRFFLTDKWIECVPYLRIFCFTYALYPIHTSNLNAIKAVGRSDIFLKLEIIKKILGAIILVSTIWFGPMVMAYSMIISGILSSFINSFPNKKLLDYSFLEQIKDILPSLLLSLVMGAIVYCFTYFHLSPLLTLIAQIISGIIIYFSGAKLFKFDTLDYIIMTIKSLLLKS